MATTRVNLTIDERTLRLAQREADQAGISLSAWLSTAARDAAVRADAARLGAWVDRHADVHEEWRREAELESEAADSTQSAA